MKWNHLLVLFLKLKEDAAKRQYFLSKYFLYAEKAL